MLFPTTIVGSFPQPDWLIDREKLAGRFPPRVRARELARSRVAALDARIAELQDARSALVRLADACGSGSAGACPIITAFEP